MGKKGKISKKKVLVTLLSLLMIAGFVWLILAASGNDQDRRCKGIAIALSNDEDSLYVDTAGIRQTLLSSDSLHPVGKKLDTINIPELKKKVEAVNWVKAAEVYLGSSNVLNIKIKQRVPVARVFRRDGQNFYLVENGDLIKASGDFAIELPVFTGFPVENKTRKDSILLIQIKKISKFIAGNKFWKAQVEQVNINSDGIFEVIPQVGDALILLGNNGDVAEKFDKLLTFYKKGLDNIGWGYYDTLDLRFEGQIVAARKAEEGNPIVNAIRKNNDPESKKVLNSVIRKE